MTIDKVSSYTGCGANTDFDWLVNVTTRRWLRPVRHKYSTEDMSVLSSMACMGTVTFYTAHACITIIKFEGQAKGKR